LHQDSAQRAVTFFNRRDQFDDCLEIVAGLLELVIRHSRIAGAEGRVGLFRFFCGGMGGGTSGFLRRRRLQHQHGKHQR
jgi:hypothetical protein